MDATGAQFFTYMRDAFDLLRREGQNGLSSAIVLCGIGSHSGVCNVSRRAAAHFSPGLKPRIPRRTSVAFMRLTRRLRSPARLSRSRFGRLGSFLLQRRDCHHLAVIPLAAKPSQKCAFQKVSIEPVRFGAPALKQRKQSMLIRRGRRSTPGTRPAIS